MSSHRALALDDVLREVFPHLAPDVDSLGRQTLARSARVCTAFSEPALDVLWNRLRDLWPLLSLLKVHLEDEQQDGKSNSYILNRLRSYAQRVHHLKVPCYYYSSGDASHAQYFTDPVTQLVSYAGDAAPLFPSLLSLEWEQNVPHGNALTAFLSPSLSYLKFWVGNRPDATALAHDVTTLENLTVSLSSRAPFLKTLRLSGAAPYSLLEFDKQSDQLRTLSLNGVSGAITLSSCALLTNLSELHIGLLDSDLVGLPPALGFRALVSLALTGSFSSITELLSAITSPIMRAFSMPDLYPTPESWADAARCFSVLAERFGASLAVLKVNCYLENQGPALVRAESALQLMDVLAPLLALHALEDVTLELRGLPLSACDADLHAMVRAWPYLRSLSLGHTPGSRTPSVYALRHFATHCAALERLHLPMMHLPVELSFDMEAGVDPSGNMKNLLFTGRHEPILEPCASQLAAFVQRTFPNLEPANICAAGWTYVIAALHELSSKE